MIIDSYTIQAQASRSYVRMESQSVSLTKGPAQVKQQPAEAGAIEDKLDLSNNIDDVLRQHEETTEKMLKQLQTAQLKLKSISKDPIPKDPTELKIKLLEAMIEALTGKKFSFRDVSLDLDLNGRTFQNASNGMQAPTELTISTKNFEYEAESMHYEAKGVVKTADGKTINIDLSLNMSREFISYSELNLSVKGQPIDPLVINYGGTASSLLGEKFEFDLDFDGNMDTISFTGEGSGFLALDKNDDGIINDGSELFGPNTGSGFGELRAYDSDGNGWIDSNDAIFDKLVIWSKDKYGNDQLFKLKDVGIGAIYLGDVDTEFSLNDNSNNTTNGIMRSTSFFLKENGKAGTIHHIDLMY